MERHVTCVLPVCCGESRVWMWADKSRMQLGMDRVCSNKIYD